MAVEESMLKLFLEMVRQKKKRNAAESRRNLEKKKGMIALTQVMSVVHSDSRIIQIKLQNTKLILNHWV